MTGVYSYLQPKLGQLPFNLKGLNHHSIAVLICRRDFATSLNTESGDSLPTIARGPSPSVLPVQSCLELHPRDAGALGSHGLGSPPLLSCLTGLRYANVYCFSLPKDFVSWHILSMWTSRKFTGVQETCDRAELTPACENCPSAAGYHSHGSIVESPPCPETECPTGLTGVKSLPLLFIHCAVF